MKKTTFFLAAAFAFSMATNAQVISFETSEGFTAGTINGQNQWSVTPFEDGTFVENQVITADAFSDGSQSLKIAKEPSVSGQVNAVIGGFYTYAEPISTENATFSADIYINEQGNSSLSLVFALVDLAANKFRTYINFAYGGVAEVLVKGSTPGMITVASTGFQWSPMTWYNVKIQTIGDTVQFSVDGVQIFEGELPSAGPVSQVRFIHDNYNGFAYIDNFRTNAEELSTNDFTITSLKHFYNQQNQTLSLNSLNL